MNDVRTQFATEVTQTGHGPMSHYLALAQAIQMLEHIRDGGSFSTLDFLTKLGELEQSYAQPTGREAIPAEWGEKLTDEVLASIEEYTSDWGRRDRVDAQVQGWTRRDWLDELEQLQEMGVLDA